MLDPHDPSLVPPCHRRHFLKMMAMGAVGAASSSVFDPSCYAQGGDPVRRFQLSAHGCGRATAYPEANKILTLDGKTHVTWLDSMKEGFLVRVRTLDEKSGRWSPVRTVGEAEDNHGGPAMTVDSEGYLHIVYYPHVATLRYRRSRRPNDASEWEQEVRFGENCTYPTLLCGPDDTLYLTVRKSQRKTGSMVALYKKPPGKDWQGPRPILKSRYPRYANFGDALAWGPDHRTLHLSSRIHEKSTREVYGKYQTVGYLVSHDFGETWRRGDGTRVKTPATSQTFDVIDSGGKGEGTNLSNGGTIAVDKDNQPWLMYSKTLARVDNPFKQQTSDKVDASQNQVFLVSLQPDGNWLRRPLRDEIARQWPQWSLRTPSGAVINREGRLFLALCRSNVNLQPEKGQWGHPTLEVLWMESDDGGRRFRTRTVSQPDPHQAHWLPNLEKPTGFNPVDRPAMIHTAGPPGENNRQILSNDVLWTRV